jgi:hypothetical protein
MAAVFSIVMRLLMPSIARSIISSPTAPVRAESISDAIFVFESLADYN